MFSPVGRYEPRRPHPRVGADQTAETEHQVPDDRRRRDRAERNGQREREPALRRREHEERPGHDHEQRDRQVRPEEDAVERPEQPQLRRNGLDSPLRCVFQGASLRRHDPDQVQRV
jgi:hypothetical protein